MEDTIIVSSAPGSFGRLKIPSPSIKKPHVDEPMVSNSAASFNSNKMTSSPSNGRDGRVAKRTYATLEPPPDH